jgi:hypothetical protein
VGFWRGAGRSGAPELACAEMVVAAEECMRQPRRAAGDWPVEGSELPRELLRCRGAISQLSLPKRKKGCFFSLSIC